MSKDLPSKRMRVFAGPNGSGKSTIIKEIIKEVRTGTYINADDIEKTANVNKFINLGDYNLSSTNEQLSNYLHSSTLLKKAQAEGYNINLSLVDNVITIGSHTNSYEAALIADYLRMLILKRGNTFTFETVMSHPGKLEIFKKAKEAGYKNYLYFVSTESVEINVRRVEERVKKGGHAVAREKIEERYIRSMDLVSQMIPYCYRCFIIDNSLEGKYRLILEVFEGYEIMIHTDDEIPDWVDNYVLQKLGV